MLVVLSPYPIARSSVQFLQANAGATFLTLSELRMLRPAALWTTLRALRPSCLKVVIQEDSERAVLPLMLTLSAVTRADEIRVADTTKGVESRVGRLSGLAGLLGIVVATASGRWVLWRLARKCSSLLRASPTAWSPPAGRRALYLKTNLMLGAKAGGSIGHIAGVANELLRREPRSEVLAPERPPLVSSQAPFTRIPALDTYGIPPEVNHFRFNVNCIRTAQDVLRTRPFDFIYQRLTLGNLAGVVLSRQFGIPLVLEYNGSEVWVSQNWGHKLMFTELANAIESVCLRHAHRVVTVSEVLVDELVARGVSRERIVWYPNCIDPSMFDPERHEHRRAELRRQWGIANDELVVLFIGTFGQWHGAETLAEAANIVLARPSPTRPRLRFVFVGDGLRLAAVRAELVSAEARGDVIFTGLVPQHEAPAYLAMADVFSSPHVPSRDGSKFFGSPTKLFEYMAMARPIVASRLDQLADVLSPAIQLEQLEAGKVPAGDETALLVEPGSAQDIARALEHLQTRPELRQALAGAARRKALHEYTWRRHVDVIVDSLR
jgi:glycosyltransferase involved in cell wall biosynthesis